MATARVCIGIEIPGRTSLWKMWKMIIIAFSMSQWPQNKFRTRKTLEWMNDRARNYIMDTNASQYRLWQTIIYKLFNTCNDLLLLLLLLLNYTISCDSSIVKLKNINNISVRINFYLFISCIIRSAFLNDNSATKRW